MILQIYRYVAFVLFLYVAAGSSHRGRNVLKSIGHKRHSEASHLMHDHLQRNKRFIRRYLINDCEVSDWSEWSNCDAYCGQGHSQRTRTMFSHPVGMDLTKTGPKVKEIKPCIAQSCEDACKAIEWSTWSQCSSTCGVGTRIKSRLAVGKEQHPMCNRLQLTKFDKCFDKPCEKINCFNLKWSEWSLCSVNCGHGQQKRYRDGHEKSNNCKKEIRPCKTKECDIDCEVSEWGAWQQCDLQCKTTRTRVKLHDSSGNGIHCENKNFVEVMDCSSSCEPCQNTEWSDWSSCSVKVPCQTGTKVRIRNRRVPDGLLNICVDRVQKDYKICTATADCNKECTYSNWSEWSTCQSNECDTTEWSVRSRKIQTEAAGTGAACSKHLLYEKMSCRDPNNCDFVESEQMLQQGNSTFKREKTAQYDEGNKHNFVKASSFSRTTCIKSNQSIFTLSIIILLLNFN